jgi:hypothetical protein
MHSSHTDMLECNETHRADVEGPLVGHIVRAMDAGQVLVDYPGNAVGPLPARSLAHVSLSRCEGEFLEGIPVLLMFESQNPALPIIVGIVGESMRWPDPSQETVLDPETRPETAVVDGKTVIIDAREQIVLKCGKSCITLRKDGKIVIRGAHLLSRASGPNRIKGASVAIN